MIYCQKIRKKKFPNFFDVGVIEKIFCDFSNFQIFFWKVASMGHKKSGNSKILIKVYVIYIKRKLRTCRIQIQIEKVWFIAKKLEKKNFKIFFFKGGTLWCFSRNRDFENQKNVKGPEKIFFFVSDFDETQNLKSLWPKDFTHEIWAESEPKIFWHIPWPRVKISGETCDEEAVFGVYGKPKIIIFIWKPILGT